MLLTSKVVKIHSKITILSSESKYMTHSVHSKENIIIQMLLKGGGTFYDAGARKIIIEVDDVF